MLSVDQPVGDARLSEFEIYIVALLNEISNFSYFHSVIFLYFQIILCLQNTAVSSISKITLVSGKLIPIYRNPEDTQELRGTQQSPGIHNTETLHEVRFKTVVYLHTVLKKGMNPCLPSFRSAYTKI